MSSTSIQIGLNEGRSSSRILKPPGGGHTDIFGNPPEPASKPNPRAQQLSESVSACFPRAEPVQKKPEPAFVESTKTEPPATNETTQAKTEPSQGKIEVNLPKEEPTQKKPESLPEIKPEAAVSPTETKVEASEPKSQISQEQPTSQQKNRVPPGGYSKGFW